MNKIKIKRYGWYIDDFDGEGRNEEKSKLNGEVEETDAEGWSVTEGYNFPTDIAICTMAWGPGQAGYVRGDGCERWCAPPPWPHLSSSSSSCSVFLVINVPATTPTVLTA